MTSLVKTPNSRVLILPLISLRFSAGFHPPFLQPTPLTNQAIPIFVFPLSHCSIKIHINSKKCHKK